MTFDEALDQLEPRTIWSSEMRDLLEQLRQEYAPTIELTKEQHDYIAPLIKEGKELGATFTEFWEVYKFIGASKKIARTFDGEEQAMHAWLHSETIKVVD